MMDVTSTNSPKMTKTQKAEYEARERKWRAESDIRTLIEAAKIRKDPERLKLALAEKKAMLADLETIKAVT